MVPGSSIHKVIRLPQPSFGIKLYTPFILSPDSYLGEAKFRFLNITHDFGSNPDWNLMTYGRLWNYNLQYLDYINQHKMNGDDAIRLIQSLRHAINSGILNQEPYPASLRIMNLVKYCLSRNHADEIILLFLTEQLQYLKNNPEYHILGNHLLENGFALFMGGYFTGDTEVFEKGKKIIRKELNRQILKDGAHIELSPMYHSILLTRLLDCINVLKPGSESSEVDFVQMLVQKASLMVGWLKKIQFRNGEVPHLNDSTNGISPKPSEIVEYADRLYIPRIEVKLKESGYRKFKRERYELVVDVGNIQPGYQPGHAHADTTSFIVNIDHKSFITDSGISTYQQDEIRHEERSTGAHNAVVVNGQNSSDVWGAFRVGKRSRIIELVDTFDSVSCKHDGYSRYGVIHEREFLITENILIRDQLNEINRKALKVHTKEAYLHFHPSVEIKIENNFEVATSLAKIIFGNAEHLKVLDYNYASGFNQREPSKCLQIRFDKSLTTTIIPN